jgi:hypothetical protein
MEQSARQSAGHAGADRGRFERHGVCLTSRVALRPARAENEPRRFRDSGGEEPSASAPRNDATALLQREHADVRKLFRQRLADEEAKAEERQALAERTCAVLTAHATIEEEFPYARRAQPRSRATGSTEPRSSTPLSRI